MAKKLRISVTVDPDRWERLLKQAKRQERSKSQIVNLAIGHYLDEVEATNGQKAPKPPPPKARDLQEKDRTIVEDPFDS